MNDHKAHIEELIFRFFRGECTPEETEYVGRWKNLSPENMATFEQMEELMEYRVFLRGAEDFDTATARGSIRKKIIRPNRTRKLLRYAAAVVLPLALVAGGILLTGRQTKTDIHAITSEGRGTFLQFGDGRQVDLKNAVAGSVQELAGSLIAEGGETMLDYTAMENVPATAGPVYHTVTVMQGEIFEIKLSDGSHVWLNSETSLSYPVQFSGQSREVRLSGEAFFEVAPNATAPFRVIIGDNSVEVTGTSFNVRNYEGEAGQSVVLETGRVVFHTAADVRELTPGQLARYDGNTLDVSEVDLRYYTSWREGAYYFDDASLEEIASTLEKWYGVDFHFADDGLKQLHFSGATSKDKPLSHILTLLESTQEIAFEAGMGGVINVRKK